MIQCPFQGWQKANKHMEERILICEKCDGLSPLKIYPVEIIRVADITKPLMSLSAKK
jgi:hypothetical protein